jgi:hypothetical protein
MHEADDHTAVTAHLERDAKRYALDGLKRCRA